VVFGAVDPVDFLPKYSSNINFISNLKVEAMVSMDAICSLLDIGKSSILGVVILESFATSLRSLSSPRTSPVKPELRDHTLIPIE
jgi:hypothetical protein